MENTQLHVPLTSLILLSISLTRLRGVLILLGYTTILLFAIFREPFFDLIFSLTSDRQLQGKPWKPEILFPFKAVGMGLVSLSATSCAFITDDR